MVDSPPRWRRGRVAAAVLAAGMVLAAAVAGGWALRVILAPAPDVLEAPGYTLVTAEVGAVEQSLRLNTAAEWSPESELSGQASGTVTGLELAAGAEVDPGDVLYTVDLRPVVAAQGEVPAFRDLSRGDEGADVAQLQRLLSELGHWSGEADGRFGDGLYWAVRSWQDELEVDVDGTVRRGDVVFVPELPARLALDADVTVGTALAGGEPIVQVLPAAPSFTITLPEGQARLVEPGMPVQIAPDGAGWSAEISQVRRGQGAEDGGTVAYLTGTGGESICGDDCEQVPLQEETLLPSVIEVVPPVDGVTVPAAAVVTTAGGDTAVIRESGELTPVTVVASATGVAVVEGVETGERVRTPGEVPEDGAR